jgi:hypothetical protein
MAVRRIPKRAGQTQDGGLTRMVGTDRLDEGALLICDSCKTDL